MRLPAVAVGLALALGLAGCSTAASSDGPARTQTLTVLAAASLTEPLTALANDFEHAHPGVAVRLSFGGSPALAQQVLAGAPADVFASANPATMDTVTAAGQATTPTVFARNTLEIAVPPDNPAGVNSVRDLARSGVKVALCAPTVPCGDAAAAVLAAARVAVRPVTLEQDVKAVLTKVRLGEVDAGLVYRTDVVAAGSAVRGIEVPEASGVVNDYLVAVLTRSRHSVLAGQLVELLTAPAGRAVLADAGFALP